MTYGAARGLKNFIDITLGTGVGSGIVIDGKMVYGCDGFAGELGHVVMVRGKEAVHAAAAELAVWKRTALQQVWLVLHANSSRRAMSLHCSAKSSQRTSPLTR